MYNTCCAYRNRYCIDFALDAVSMIDKRIVKEDFVTRNAEELAPWLLGKYICHKQGDNIIRLKITETECYLGENDTACHASKGKTKRNAPMYLSGGHLYVYLCYGIHSLINVVSGKEGSPEAVLIRGVEGALGPGKASKALGIDVSFSGHDLCNGDKAWLEYGLPDCKYVTSTRVGIDYASKEDRERPWRFILKD